jgi:hypothetical protein
MTLWDKLDSIQPRYLYGVTFALCAIIMLSNLPPAVPAETSWWIKKCYDLVESLKPGDVVIIWHDNSPAPYIAHMAGGVAMINHMIMRGIKTIHVGLYPESVIMNKIMTLPQVRTTMEKYGYEYGKDYVNLGYIAGREAGAAAFYANLKIVTTDIYGTPVDQIPIMQGLKTVEDIKAVIVLSAITGPYHMRQAAMKYKKPVIVIGMEGASASYIADVEAGNMYSFIDGWSGAAQYEKLIGITGMGYAGVNGLSVLYLCIALFVIVGNVGYLAKKISRRL